MDEIKLKKLVAGNITRYRKESGLTQAMLAELLNYSDKSISKWERGDGLPDIGVLVAMAEIFSITVNDLVYDPDEAPTAETKPQETRTPGIVRKNRIIITMLSVGLVWLAASVAFFVLKLIFPEASEPAYAFLLAVPVSFIVATVMVSLWWGMELICTMVSGLVWSLAICVNALLPLKSSELIFLVAAVFQVLIVLWYFLKFRPEKLFSRKSSKNDNNSDN